jgi:AhpC/TSA family
MGNPFLRAALLGGAALLVSLAGCKSSSQPAKNTGGNTQPGAINYTILVGNGRVADKFGGILGLPTSMLYSRDGKKVTTVIGSILQNPAVMEKAVETQLAEKEPGGSVTPAPETSLDIPGLDGTEHTIEQYKGKVVLVNFWATWCQPCRAEIPWLINLQKKYGPQGLVILGIAMDDEGKKVVQPFVQNQRFDVAASS